MKYCVLVVMILAFGSFSALGIADIWTADEPETIEKVLPADKRPAGDQVQLQYFGVIGTESNASGGCDVTGRLIYIPSEGAMPKEEKVTYTVNSHRCDSLIQFYDDL